MTIKNTLILTLLVSLSQSYWIENDGNDKIARFISNDANDEIPLAVVASLSPNDVDESEQHSLFEDYNNGDFSNPKENDITAVKLIKQATCLNCRQGKRRPRFNHLKRRISNGQKADGTLDLENVKIFENDSEDNLEKYATLLASFVDDTRAVKLLKQKKRCRETFCKKLKKFQRFRDTVAGPERDEEILNQDDSKDGNGELQRRQRRGRKRHHKRIRKDKSRAHKKCGKFSGICCDESAPSVDKLCADRSKPKCSEEECKRFSVLDFFAKLFETTA